MPPENSEIAIENDHNDEYKRVTTLLIFPPQWTPQNPHFAITSIAGHLRTHGHKVLLRDLNVEFYDYILTPEYIRLATEKMRMDYSYLSMQIMLKSLVEDKSLEFQLEAVRYLAMEQFIKDYGNLIEKLPHLILDAKETLRDPRRFYNPLMLVDAFFAIDRSLELISLPFHPSSLSFNSFEQPHCLLETQYLIQHATNPKVNMFYEYFAERVPEILAEKPGLIGVSINSFSQVLPGLTLAAMLREKAPEGCTVNIGGNFFGRVKHVLLKRPEFFKTFCHTLSMGEGEKQSLLLIEQLNGEKDFSKVPNLLYYDEEEGKVKFSFEGEPEKLDNLGFQDLHGLPMELYFSPEPVLCLQSSKGCYWGKCTFCDTDFGIHRGTKSLDHLIEEIRYLKTNYGVRHFEFIDESIHPEYMKKMAERLIKEKLDIFWFSNGRLEDAFTKELLELLHKSGLTMVLWGVESGSDRIMKLINKGINLDKRWDILRQSTEAGIWNFAYIFFGFPTETREEAMETINAMVKFRDIIHCYGRSVFSLGKHSLLYIDKDKYGIMDVVEDMEELSTNLHYKSTGGLTDEEIDGMMKECTKICAEAYEYALWYYLRYRENIHLYLVKHGRDYVDKFKVQQALSNRLNIW